MKATYLYLKMAQNSSIFFVIFFAQIIKIYAQNVYFIDSLKNNKIYVSYYDNRKKGVININDLYLVNRRTLVDSLNYIFIWDKPRFREIILSKGLGKFKNPLKSKAIELAYQNSAKDKKIGIWRNEIKNNKKTEDDYFYLLTKKFLLWLSITYKFILAKYEFIISTIVSLGIISILYKKLWVERSLRLLIVGESSSGKSVLMDKILDPNTNKDELLNSSPTPTTQKKKGKKVTLGTHDVFPIVTDVAGAKYTEIWNKLFSRNMLRYFRVKNNAFIYVLAPMRKSINNSDGINKPLAADINNIDRDYINVQLGALKVFLGSLNSSVMKYNRPKIIILFISKFDVLSNNPPNDTSSVEQHKLINNVFKEHKEFASNEAHKGNVKFEYIVGSATENWGVAAVTRAIEKNLYL